MFGHVQSAIAHYGYIAVALGILLEDFGLPTPGETLLITGAIGASQGALNIWLLLLLGWAGGVIGDNIGYVIGYTGGHRLMLRFGSRIGITDAKLRRVERYFARRGSVVILFARFVVVLRQFNGIVAGTLEMQWWRFVILNAIGAALWVGFWGGFAYVLGKRFYLFLEDFEQHRILFYIVAAGAAAGIAGCLIYWKRRHRRERSSARRSA